DLPRQPARHQRPVAVEEQVVGFGPVAATDDVDVARATGDDQPGPGTLALDQRVDGNGRAMDEFVDGRGRDAALADAVDDALHEIGRRGQAFRLHEPAGLVVETDQIREGAADVDRDKDHARTLLGSTCGPDGQPGRTAARLATVPKAGHGQQISMSQREIYKLLGATRHAVQRRQPVHCLIDAVAAPRYRLPRSRSMQDIKERVALSSIAASAGLTIAKAVVGWLSGSLGILSEAGHSLVDLGATVLTYFAVRISGKPADEEHHYGHGKVESLAALAETALLFLLSGVVIWEAMQRLFWHEPVHVQATVWAFGVIVASIVVDFFRARVLYRVAHETSSEASEADALHFGSDMWSSVAVLIGLVGVLFGYPWADSLAAIVVAVFICVAGWRLGRRTIDSLTDVAPPGAAQRIAEIARRVRRVVDVERVRARAVGNKLFVDLTLPVSPPLPFHH